MVFAIKTIGNSELILILVLGETIYFRIQQNYDERNRNIDLVVLNPNMKWPQIEFRHVCVHFRYMYLKYNHMVQTVLCGLFENMCYILLMATIMHSTYTTHAKQTCAVLMISDHASITLTVVKHWLACKNI